MAKKPSGRPRGRPPGRKNNAEKVAEVKAAQEAKAAKPTRKLPDEKAGSAAKATRADIDVFLTQSIRYANQASEASGNLGQFTNQFVERHALDKSAVTALRRYAKMDPAKRAFAWADLKYLMETAGFDSTTTLFEEEENERREVQRSRAQADDEGADGEAPEAPANDDPPSAGDDEERDLRPRFLRDKGNDEPASPEAEENAKRLRGGIRQLEGADAAGSYQKH